MAADDGLFVRTGLSCEGYVLERQILGGADEFRIEELRPHFRIREAAFPCGGFRADFDDAHAGGAEIIQRQGDADVVEGDTIAIRADFEQGGDFHFAEADIR